MFQALKFICSVMVMAEKDKEEKKSKKQGRIETQTKQDKKKKRHGTETYHSPTLDLDPQLKLIIIPNPITLDSREKLLQGASLQIFENCLVLRFH